MILAILPNTASLETLCLILSISINSADTISGASIKPPKVGPTKITVINPPTQSLGIARSISAKVIKKKSATHTFLAVNFFIAKDQSGIERIKDAKKHPKTTLCFQESATEEASIPRE